MNNLKKIQTFLKKNNINLFIINRSDEFLNENIAPYAERLKWISNFSGSAGRAFIFQNKAILFIDGRYKLQAREEVNKDFQIKSLLNYWDFFHKFLRKNKVIGLDPSLHSITEISKIIAESKKLKIKINFFKKNPIDFFWNNQPISPKKKIFIHEEKFCGKSITKKIYNFQLVLKKELIDYYLITSLDSIAWLLNIRGNDILYSPLTFCYLLVPKVGRPILFTNLTKIRNIRNYLKKNINYYSFKHFEKFISKIDKSKIIGLDFDKINYTFQILFDDIKIKTKNLFDPCVYPKAQKNLIEINGAKKANIRDGISITKFLFWLKNNNHFNKTDEIKAFNYLYNLRKKNNLFYSLSFETISAVNNNAALPHYRTTEKTNQYFKKNSIYLVDSGAQYFDGTTDITRTIILGRANKEQKDRYTRVLKGHIALANAIFKENINTSKLDKLARKSLNEIKCDYDHGTGHGVGSFLNVHEGPQRITKFFNNSPLKIGMILSNEPGFYKDKKYGIRTENLIIVCKKNNSKIGFETISFAPFDIDLIEIKMLNNQELNWINNYHSKVYKLISSKLNNKEKQWLKKVTKPLIIP